MFTATVTVRFSNGSEHTETLCADTRRMLRALVLEAKSGRIAEDYLDAHPREELTQVYVNDF